MIDIRAKLKRVVELAEDESVSIDVGAALEYLVEVITDQQSRIAELEARVADRMLTEMAAAVPTVTWPEFPPIHDPAKRYKV